MRSNAHTPLTAPIMTLNEIRTELVAKTERKIQEMKARSIILPERRADLCELCDMLSQEIYEFAIHTTRQIADRNHLRKPLPSLLDELHEDICMLTNGALDILVPAPGSGGMTRTRPAKTSIRKAFRFSLPSLFGKPDQLQLFFSRLKGLAGLSTASACC